MALTRCTLEAQTLPAQMQHLLVRTWTTVVRQGASRNCVARKAHRQHARTPQLHLPCQSLQVQFGGNTEVGEPWEDELTSEDPNKWTVCLCAECWPNIAEDRSASPVRRPPAKWHYAPDCLTDPKTSNTPTDLPKKSCITGTSRPCVISAACYRGHRLPLAEQGNNAFDMFKGWPMGVCVPLSHCG